MMLLTLVVWIHMYVIRTRYLVLNRVDLRKVNTPEKAAQVIPAMGIDISLRSVVASAIVVISSRG